MSALVVETIREKLERALPGAKVFRPLRPLEGAPVPPTEAWRVVRDGRVLATAATEREAVDRALFLWEGRR